MTLAGNIRKTLFGIRSEREVFNNYGFIPEAWQNFDFVAKSLVEGYHASLEDSRFEVLVPKLNAIEPALHGFAYEGAGMGIAAFDILLPWNNQVEAFVGKGGPASPHIYPTYVGVGLALARLKRNPEKFLTRLTPLFDWVVVDGYGFHEAFFSWKRVVDKKETPSHFSEYALHLFDQGMGRAIWFMSGAQVERVVSVIDSFPTHRQSDLWSGVGCASSYAGGGKREELEHAREAADAYKLQLAYGAAVAAQGRARANIMVPHTRLACEVYCGLESDTVIRIANEASEDITPDGTKSVHQIWSERLRSELATISNVEVSDIK